MKKAVGGLASRIRRKSSAKSNGPETPKSSGTRTPKSPKSPKKEGYGNFEDNEDDGLSEEGGETVETKIQNCIDNCKEGSDDMIEDALTDLWDIAVLARNRKPICEMGGVDVIVDLARQDLNPVALRAAAGALRNMCLDHIARDTVMRSGGIDALLVLCRHPDIAVATEAVAAIWNASLDDDTAKEVLKEIKDRDTNPLDEVLDEYSTDAEMARLANGAMRALGLGETDPTAKSKKKEERASFYEGGDNLGAYHNH